MEMHRRGRTRESSRDRARREMRERESSRDRDRARGRERDMESSREKRERRETRGRERSRDIDSARGRERGRPSSRERSRERESSRDRDRARGRERDMESSRERRERRERGRSRDIDSARGRERLGKPDMVVTSASERNIVQSMSGPLYRRLYVKNLPAKMTVLNLRELFRPHGIVEVVELPLVKTGECKGFGFVQFAQREDAQKARISLNKQLEIEGIKIEVSFVTDQFSEAILGAQSKALSNEAVDMTYVAAKCLSLASENDRDRPCVLDSLINKANLVFNLLNQRLVFSNPTECLQLKNMFKLKTEELFEKFREDVETLAKKYGVLKHLYIDQNIGRNICTVYMRFETVQEALAMQRVMHLSCYCENLVYAVFLPPQVYEAMNKTFLVRDGIGGRDDAEISIPATVVLRHMFSQAEMRADETLCDELEENVKEEGVKHGPLLSVKVCKLHPQGVVLITFKDRKDAQKCIDANEGRWYAGRQINASLDDGSVNHDEIRDFDLEGEW